MPPADPVEIVDAMDLLAKHGLVTDPEAARVVRDLRRRLLRDGMNSKVIEFENGEVTIRLMPRAGWTWSDMT